MNLSNISGPFTICGARAPSNLANSRARSVLPIYKSLLCQYTNDSIEYL